MLYLDYARAEGDWVPNRFGGRENLEAIAFLRWFNDVVQQRHPGAVTIAEESTAWPMVSRPGSVGGLGFDYKWNMGWMHDLLDYMSHEPVHRRFHHSQLTFGLLYAWHENFILPLSHDEVVYGKGSLHHKMPGDDWQKFANLRLFYAFMYGYPGKKLMFMGAEFGQTREWYHEASLDWHLLDTGPLHRGLQTLVRDLNRLYRGERALHQVDFEPAGFQWIDCDDADQSVVSFVRRARDSGDFVLVDANFTPVPWPGYRVGAPRGGYYRELLNTDATVYGGSGLGNAGGAWAEPQVLAGTAVLTGPDPAAAGHARPQAEPRLSRAAPFATLRPEDSSGRFSRPCPQPCSRTTPLRAERAHESRLLPAAPRSSARRPARRSGPCAEHPYRHLSPVRAGRAEADGCRRARRARSRRRSGRPNRPHACRRGSPARWQLSCTSGGRPPCPGAEARSPRRR
jgi:hypothetical protein